MQYRRRSIVSGIVAGLVLTVLISAGATAHERRTLGEYEVVVGFLNEPAIVEEPNGLDFRVQRGSGDGAEPVEGLAGALQAEVIYGGQTMELELEPAFGQPGAYRAEFIPTAEGAYTFHITGNIEGMEFDEQFTSGPETFSEVASRDALNFPNAVDTIGNVQATAEDAKDGASTAQMLGIAGLVAGIAGLIAGVAALIIARRPQSGPEPAQVAAHDAAD